jgi:hypothetical protein
MSFWGSRKGWEQHPCRLPEWEKIPTKNEVTVIGSTWKCKCGRRWMLLGVEQQTVNEKGDFIVVMDYDEVIDGSGVSEDDIGLFHEWAEEGTF